MGFHFFNFDFFPFRFANATNCKQITAGVKTIDLFYPPSKIESPRKGRPGSAGGCLESLKNGPDTSIFSPDFPSEKTTLKGSWATGSLSQVFKMTNSILENGLKLCKQSGWETTRAAKNTERGLLLTEIHSRAGGEAVLQTGVQELPSCRQTSFHSLTKTETYRSLLSPVFPLLDFLNKLLSNYI